MNFFLCKSIKISKQDVVFEQKMDKKIGLIVTKHVIRRMTPDVTLSQTSVTLKFVVGT